LPEWSETVRVVSLVGRFLEHSRIYYFQNGGDEEYYIGSADCMNRNLESRVEVLVPVEAPELRKELRHVLNVMLSEPRGAWEMQSDGSYRESATDGDDRSAQQALIERAAKQHKGATRLKRRGLRSTPWRNED
jgi:polyphosphate kinase